MMNTVLPWNELIKVNLLRYNVVNGVFFATKNGVELYAFGELAVDEPLPQNELKKILNAFHQRNSGEETYTINFKNAKSVTFKVYKQSHCSMYATSSSNRDGLVICNLPHGVMLCTYHLPTPPSDAISAVERFCDMLRA